ncbi:MAG TPA: SLC13 family permease [Xanthomonadaceae bacterium]|jgi:di/tricarboxylate transporter|nr:SLC13 family permease [Xanthomonadaceae bacterium]
MDASTSHALTSDMVVVLCLMAFTMLMFMIDRIRADLVALTALIALGLSRVTPADRLFDGFAGNAVISVMATMILGAGLDRTGVLNRLSGWLLRRSRGLEERMVTLTCAVAGMISPTMQNPAVMSLFLPVASRLSARTGVTPSRLLLPIVSAIIMGGSLTMVGNSPLILLNDLLVSANRNIPSGVATLVPLKMFAPFPIGAALLAACLIYYRWFGGRLLEEGADKNITPGRTESYFAEAYGIDGEVFELTVTAESPIVGMSVGEVEVQKGAPLLLALRTGEESRLAPPAKNMLWVGSVIGMMGSRAYVAEYAQAHKLKMSTRLRQFGDLFNPSLAGISEAVIPPNSHYIGKKLSDIRLRSEHGISVLAINRDGQIHREDIRDMALKAGDMLVLHSVWTHLALAARSRDFVVITDYPKEEQRPHKLKIALAIFALALCLALSGSIPTPLALMAGATGMLLAGVLNMDEAFAAISWKTVFLMACLIPIGAAMDNTGAADWVARGMLDLLPRNPSLYLVQAVVALITVGFTLVISQVGATVVMVPMAINIAIAANGNPTAFALIVALAASNNFLSASNPVIGMVVGPAGYKPIDLLRVGGPLTLVYLMVELVMVNLMF